MELTIQQNLEQRALGALLFEKETENYLTLLKKEYLTFEHHITIYEAIEKASTKGYECGFEAVSAMFGGDDKVKETLVSVLEWSEKTNNLKDMCKLLHESYLKRVGTDLIQECLDDMKFGDKTLFQVNDKITDVLIKQPTWEAPVKFKDVILQACESASNVEERRGFSPHLKEWQYKIGDFCPSEVHTISGFPSVGKSALALNLTWNMCKNGAKVRYISLEETQDKLMYRLLAEESSVPVTAFKYGLNPKQQEDVTIAGDRIHKHDFTVDTSSKTIGEMMNACVEQERETGLDIVVIDPISYVEFSPEPAEFEKANKIGLFALQLAQRCKCAVLLISHVNAFALSKDKKGNIKEPSMTNLYGGMGLAKPSFSVVELRRANDDIVPKGCPLQIDAFIIKVRDGAPNQKMRLDFWGEFMRFNDSKGAV